jgi:uncharacterized protein YfdQ (DUF2303 family)
MDHSAIEAIGQLAVESSKANFLPTEIPAIIIRSDAGGQAIRSLEHLQPGRSRFRGTFTSTGIGAFAKYVVAQSKVCESAVHGFIDPASASATVYFNLGDYEHAGHGDHIAHLKLKATAAYSALKTAVNAKLSQRDLHDFVEDWRDLIVPVIDGKADASSVPSALAAIRDITLSEAREANFVERDLGSSRSAMESVDASSKHTLPTGFLFVTPPYEGLPPRTFELRLGVNSGAVDKLNLTLRIKQAEKVVEEIAEDFRAQLDTMLGTACSLTLGSFTP